MGYIVSKLVKKEDIPMREDLLKAGEIKVDEKTCIGCGLCAKLAPDYFSMENKKAVVIKDIEADSSKEPIEAMRKCPVNSIEI